jgi:hypothetical protein
MMSKPVAVVLLVAAVVIAAFVGGYVYQQLAGPTADVDGPVLEGEEIPSRGARGRSDDQTVAPARARGNGSRPSAPNGPGQSRTSQPPQGDPATAPPGTSTASLAGAATAPARGPIDVVVPAGTIITLQLITALSSETAKVEDRVEAMIGDPVIVDQILAVPKGTKVLGSVTTAVKGGKVKEVAQVGVRFHTLVLGPEPGINLVIDPIVQLGVAPSGRSKATIGGGAAVGALTGWLLGGTQGAIKGGVTGAGGGAAATMIVKAQPAVVPAGARAPVALGASITVRVERE